MDKVEGLQVDNTKQCRATITLGIMIAEPLKNGNWRPFHVNNDSIGLLLTGNNQQEVMDNLYAKLKELKQLWGENGTSMTSLQEDATQTSFRMPNDL